MDLRTLRAIRSWDAADLSRCAGGDARGAAGQRSGPQARSRCMCSVLEAATATASAVGVAATAEEQEEHEDDEEDGKHVCFVPPGVTG